MKKTDVLCAGIIVVDHVAAPIDEMPEAGHLVLTDECFLTMGGSAGNVAVDLCKMGVANTISGCVGDDPFGDFAAKVLETAGVDVAGLVRTSNAATSQTLIVNVKGQDRRFIHHLGANRLYSAKHISREQARASRILYLGGLFLMDSLDADELSDVFRDAREHGVVTMLDVVTPGPGDYARDLEIVLPHTDVFLPNMDEGVLMVGERDPLAQAELYHKMGAKTAVVTCGGEGSFLVSERLKLHAGSFAVKFVDGTGGGDAFDTGFICGILEGAGLERCLELGSALGASCVQRSGATDGVFTRREADEFLKLNKLAIETI